MKKGRNNLNGDNNTPIKVLYIAGPTRSGSTILSNILGEIDGFFNAGEVIEAWDRGREWKCSCGEDTKDCKIWSKIFQAVNDKLNTERQMEIIRMRNKLSRSFKVIIRRYQKTKDGHVKKRYLNGLSILYRAIQEHTNAEVVIDASKNIGYCDTLSEIQNIDLNIVHLIRDSRATVFSWTKKKNELWTASPIKMAAEWSSRNLAAEVLRKRNGIKYIKIRYEDFIEDPQEWVQEILKIITKSEMQLPFVSMDEVEILNSHGLCGNPGRYKKGPQKLKLDNSWKKMNAMDRFVTTIVTFPLLKKYRYPLHGI
jgi:LPS sulfotransferase NodH